MRPSWLLRRSEILALIPLLLPACGDDGGTDGPAKPPSPPADCDTAPAADGSFAIAVGSRCLEGVTLRVQSGGSWQAAGADDGIDVAAASGGARITLRSARASVEAFELRIPAVPGEAVLQQGYQSWGFSGAVQIPASYAADSGGAPIFKAAEEGDPIRETAGVSYGSAVVGGGADGVLVVGALSADRATTGIAAKRAAAGADLSVVYGALREPLPADDDGVVRSEVIALFADAEPNAGLAKLAAEMATALPSGAAPPKRPPGGWFSWNEHFEAVDQALVEAHIDVVAEKLLPKGLPLLEIDDGWERAWGDWQANEKFPDGMEAVGAAITGKGLTAGVWMAPFLVDVTSDVAQTIDRSLLVQGSDGQPLAHVPGGHTKSYYVLDGTNPEAMKVATDAVAALSAAGFRFFKFDFLYAGALVGARSKPGATGNQALRAGLELLREAAGADAIINACGTPVLPVLGIADSLRVGADTVYSGLPPSWAFVASAGRSLAARSFLHPLIWPDADQVLLRAPFSEAEALVGATVAAMAGPAYSMGDDLATLDAARLAIGLGDDLLDIAGADAPAVPKDLLEAPVKLPPGNPVLDAIGSAGQTGAPPPSAWSAVGKSGARYDIAFTWLDDHKVTITKAP